MIAEIGAEGPPLRGIVHAAGVLDDGVLLNQSAARFSTAMAAKVRGACHLHALTRDLPLDFLVFFSSMASLLGSPAQANYAAANAFLDSFAHWLRARGRPALSINWGPWAEVGMAARGASAAAPAGMGALTPARALHAFGQLLASTEAQVAVLPVRWPELLAAFPAGQAPPLFAEIAREARRAAPAPAFDLRAHLDQARPSERRALLSAHVTAEVGRALGLGPSEALAPKDGFFASGMDSLMAVTLRNRLQAQVGRALPTTLLFEQPTIEALSDYLAKELLLETPPEPEPDVEAAEPPDALALAAAAIEDLSDEEMLALLTRQLDRTH